MHGQGNCRHKYLDVCSTDCLLSSLGTLVFKGYIKNIVIITKGFFLDTVCLLLELALLVSKLLLLSIGCNLQSKQCSEGVNITPEPSVSIGAVTASMTSTQCICKWTVKHQHDWGRPLSNTHASSTKLKYLRPELPFLLIIDSSTSLVFLFVFTGGQINVS